MRGPYLETNIELTNQSLQAGGKETTAAVILFSEIGASILHSFY
jgi:hypothetical protein